MNGTTMTKTVQPALPQPEMSERRNRSAKITMNSQNHMIQANRTNIVHSTSNSGYPLPSASIMAPPGKPVDVRSHARGQAPVHAAPPHPPQRMDYRELPWVAGLP